MSKLVANQISPRSGSDLTLNGNVSVGGTLTYNDVTNIDSVGLITARSGVKVTAGGVDVTAGGLNVTAGISTFAGDVSIGDSITHSGDNTAIRFPAADTFTVETGGSERLRITSDGNIGINSIPTTKLDIYRSGSGVVGRFGKESIFGEFFVAGTEVGLQGTRSSDSEESGFFVRNPTNTGTSNFDHVSIRTVGSERLRITSTGGVHFNNAELIERVSIVANKLSAVPNVNLDNGMVHYYTTNETTTANPNIVSSAGINTNMATGDTMSVTILSKPNGAGYFPRISIDGRLAGITTYWSGGSAPSSAESSGVDVNVYQIIKTGSETFDVLANTSNFA